MLTIDGDDDRAAPQEGGEPLPATLVAVDGDAADDYVHRLRRAIIAARLNALFPPTAGLLSHLAFLGPSGSRGVYPSLQLSRSTGLPTAREIRRVRIDRELAAEFLARAASRPPPAEDGPVARRLAYYSALASARVLPSNRMTVDLRQQLPDESLARFRITYDRFDLASGLFVRYTILLTQRDRFWGTAHLVVDDRDLAAPTEAFRRTVARFTAHEAELAFVLLSTLEGIEVEDVRRCRIGPLLSASSDGLGAVAPLFEANDGPAWILCFPEDRASTDLATHASGDPLAPLYREVLSEDVREVVDAKADELGYRVTKCRKFVCSEALRRPLARLCRELGAPSIVRGVAESAR